MIGRICEICGMTTMVGIVAVYPSPRTFRVRLALSEPLFRICVTVPRTDSLALNLQCAQRALGLSAPECRGREAALRHQLRHAAQQQRHARAQDELTRAAGGCAKKGGVAWGGAACLSGHYSEFRR